jgi:hypothetical protein
MVSSIPRNHFSLNFLVNVILTCYHCFQMFELRHIFERFLNYLYIMGLNASVHIAE